MKALTLEPKVISLANTLGIEGDDALAGIRDYCVQRVRDFIRGFHSVTNIRALQRVICEKLNLTIHEIWSDAELSRVTESYVADGEPVFAFFGTDLDADTYGVLVRLNKRVGKAFAWAALVDCRGDKQHRRFFTAWHEIVHCITAADQYELPFHRTIIGKLIDPLERVVDIVAGDLAFFEPLFQPLLEREVLANGRLTFASVERVRVEFCPDASFEATINACVKRMVSPVMFLKAAMILKDAEQAAIDSPQKDLFPRIAPERQLRVLTTIRNEHARRIRLHIPRHFRVPESSIINLVYLSKSIPSPGIESVENLRDWTCSDGKALAPFGVHVNARKSGDQVFALIAPDSD
jgi:hypothetical protein